jgi:hypothetical protein
LRPSRQREAQSSDQVGFGVRRTVNFCGSH